MPRPQRWLLGTSALLAASLPLLLFPDPVLAGFGIWLGVFIAGLAALPRGASLRACLAMLAAWVLITGLLMHWTVLQGWRQPDAASLFSLFVFLLPPLLPAGACLLLRTLWGWLARRRGPGESS